MLSPFYRLLQTTIVLNSKSPRRKQILESMNLKVDVRNFSCDESYPEELAFCDIPRFIAEKKDAAFTETLTDNELLVCSDTMVFCEGKRMGKPANEKEAKEMLTLLSGREHEVISGVSVRNTKERVSFSESTKVFFKPLSLEEIDYYIKTFSPFDKAGSYGIQEWIGMAGIEKIEGDYYNVMGLPAGRLFDCMLKMV